MSYFSGEQKTKGSGEREREGDCPVGRGFVCRLRPGEGWDSVTGECQDRIDREKARRRVENKGEEKNEAAITTVDKIQDVTATWKVEF